MNEIIKKALLSERFEVNNSGDSARQCAISAVVTIEEGKVTRVERGRVVKLEDADADANSPIAALRGRIADFDRSFGSRLNVRFGEWEGHDNSEVLSEVEAFIKQCEQMAAL